MTNHFWRMFFAIPLTSIKQEELRQNLLRSDVQLPARVIEPPGWHITLFFINSIAEEKVELLIKQVREKTWPEKFEITLDHFGASPSAQAASTIWLGLSKGKSILNELIAELSEELSEFGLPTDPQFANGHLVLSRMSVPKNVTDLLEKEFLPIHLQVKRFTLFRSVPNLGISHYEEVASFYLPSSW